MLPPIGTVMKRIHCSTRRAFIDLLANTLMILGGAGVLASGDGLKSGWRMPAALLLPVPIAIYGGGVAMAQNVADASAERVQALQESAEAGDAEAQYNLGLMFAEGKGVVRGLHIGRSG